MYRLTEEGSGYLRGGLPEKRILNLLSKGVKTDLTEIRNIPGANIGLGWARKKGWIVIEGSEVEITDKGVEVVLTEQEEEKALKEVESSGVTNEDMIKLLLSRKLIEEGKFLKPIPKEKKSFFGKVFGKKKETIEEIREIKQLTPEMIRTGSWKSKSLRKYDVTTPAPTIYPGKKQPYMQVIDEIKEKLIGLGFEEMKGPLVETNFWNMDALFIPQDHPARGIHDVLILKNPVKGMLPDQNLVARVKATHEGGWVTDSRGWGDVWDEDKASQLLMRSQTTPVSARTLVEKGDVPGKYFTIDRVYRYDVIDATHLPEFKQLEGIVVGENLTLRHLFGFIQELSDALGLGKVRFKPGYFPFTEPSTEGYIRHPKFGWIEVFAAGIFRPEVVRPLGIEKMTVLAWGFGLGRMAMIKLGIDDIRMLYSNDLKWLREKELL